MHIFQVMAIVFLFICVMHFLITDWCEALVAIMRGRLVLDRVQVSAIPSMAIDHC